MPRRRTRSDCPALPRERVGVPPAARRRGGIPPPDAVSASIVAGLEQVLVSTVTALLRLVHSPQRRTKRRGCEWSPSCVYSRPSVPWSQRWWWCRRVRRLPRSASRRCNYVHRRTDGSAHDDEKPDRGDHRPQPFRPLPRHSVRRHFSAGPVVHSPQARRRAALPLRRGQLPVGRRAERRRSTATAPPSTGTSSPSTTTATGTCPAW
jgi:hypothetical protein